MKNQTTQNPNPFPDFNNLVPDKLPVKPGVRTWLLTSTSVVAVPKKLNDEPCWTIPTSYKFDETELPNESVNLPADKLLGFSVPVTVRNTLSDNGSW